MTARVLLTGITGFVGSHLAERLLADGHEVHGVAFEPPPHPNLAAIVRDVRIHAADLADPDALAAAVDAARPDAVVHLAGQAIPTQAAKDPVGAVKVNVLGTAAVLTALDAAPGASFVFASSAEVYGSPKINPVHEQAEILPLNPYAATKVAAEALVREAGDRERRPVVILRPMNQIGPRQHPGLVASAFAKQIAEAEAGKGPPVIRHGSLDARRDFLDVRDMADAYARAAGLRPDGAEIFNVGTGHAVGIDEILTTLMGLARTPVRAELDPGRTRSGTATTLALDATRFRRRTGWEPRTPLETSLRDLLDYWRAQSREGARVS